MTSITLTSELKTTIFDGLILFGLFKLCCKNEINLSNLNLWGFGIFQDILPATEV